MVNTTPQPFNPREREPLSTVEERGWSSVLDLNEKGKFYLHRGSKYEATSELLYRIRYSGRA